MSESDRTEIDALRERMRALLAAIDVAAALLEQGIGGGDIYSSCQGALDELRLVEQGKCASKPQ